MRRRNSQLEARGWDGRGRPSADDVADAKTNGITLGPIYTRNNKQQSSSSYGLSSLIHAKYTTCIGKRSKKVCAHDALVKKGTTKTPNSQSVVLRPDKDRSSSCNHVAASSNA